MESDVDFNKEVCFPILANNLYGHKHTLSNIVIDLEKCDNVGIISTCRGSVDSLCMKNVLIKGHDNVGGIAKHGYIDRSNLLYNIDGSTAVHVTLIVVSGGNNT